jgi:type II secretory pathway pseudopilin PulG
MNNHQKSFTLLEMMIYVALFSLIMIGSLITAWELIRTSQMTSERVTIEEEGNFLMRTMSWALTGVSSISTPSVLATTTDTLVVHKYGFPANPITIRYNSASSSIEIQEGVGNPFYPLTTPDVSVSGLEFAYREETGLGPAGVLASTTISGIAFALTKYIRE